MRDLVVVRPDYAKASDAELLEAAERWAEMLKTIPQLYIRSIKYGHYQAMQMEYLQREMDFAHFIWPQQISEERKEAAASQREKRVPKYRGQ